MTAKSKWQKDEVLYPCNKRLISVLTVVIGLSRRAEFEIDKEILKEIQ